MMNRRALVSVFVLVGVLSALTLWVLSFRFTPFPDDDSAEYLEAADNFAAGRGFSVWPYGIEEDDGLAPLATFPPGYPFLVYLVSRFGIDPWRAGVFVPKIAFLLLPAAFFLALRGFFGDPWALLVALFSSCFALYVQFAMFAMSELPFVVLVAFGFAALFRAFSLRDMFFSETVRLRIVAAVLLFVLLAGVVVILRRPFTAERRQNRPAIALQGIVLVLYVVFGMSLVVAARTRYYWGEEVNPRHFIPFIWLLVAWSFFAAREWWARLRPHVSMGGAPLLALFLGTLALPQVMQTRDVLRWMAWEKEVEGRALALAPMIRSFPEETALVSSWGSRMQLLLRMPVRNLREDTPEELAASPPAERDMVVIFLGDEDWVDASWDAAREGTPPPGYRLLRHDGKVVVLFREKGGATGG